MRSLLIRPYEAYTPGTHYMVSKSRYWKIESLGVYFLCDNSIRNVTFDMYKNLQII